MPGSSASRLISLSASMSAMTIQAHGQTATGGELASPIVADFMQMALKDKPATPFRVPKGIELMPIDDNRPARCLWRTGVILEAFKPGEDPADDDGGDRREFGAPVAAASRRDRRWVDDRHGRALLTHRPISRTSDARGNRRCCRSDEAVDGLLRRHL